MVYLLLGTGCEETEAIAPLDLLRRAGVEVLTVGVNGKTVYGGHGIGIPIDDKPSSLHNRDWIEQFIRWLGYYVPIEV